MSNPLASFVNYFILNPGTSVILDDDGLEESSHIEKNINDTTTSGISKLHTNVSKLRIRNELLLGEKDVQYKGKKVSRKDVTQNDDTYDPDLAKYFIAPNNNELNDLSHDDEEDISENELEDEKRDIEVTDTGSEDDDTSGNTSDEDKVSDSESFDGGHFGEDRVMLDKQDDDHNSSIILASNEGINRSQDIKNQNAIMDTLFEARIGLQKVVTISNQLPQYHSFDKFLQANNETYNENLHTARRVIKKLVKNLIELQGIMYSGIDDLHISSLSGSVEGDEEKESKGGKKRKLEEFEETLAKRYEAFIPYRDKVLMQWHGKTKLLSQSHSKKGSHFDDFEISPVQQMNNILANKDQLIRRTQLIGMTRGNIYSILGKEQIEQTETLLDKHDPEIFDDSDFYSHILEDFLKAKMTTSGNVSKQWMEVQNLRKKAKKKVDVRATKGRAIRHDVMNKVQQYMAPCKQPKMTDSAINQLFASLFSKSLNAVDR